MVSKDKRDVYDNDIDELSLWTRTECYNDGSVSAQQTPFTSWAESAVPIKGECRADGPASTQ